MDAILPEDAGVTKVMLGLAVGIYVLIGLAAGGTSLLAQSAYTTSRFGSGSIPFILDGELWRFVTPVFLHGGVVHIGFNLYWLWQLGPMLERSLGRARYTIAFVLTGVLSTMIALGWKVIAPTIWDVLPLLDASSAANITTSMVGMSGAICGLLGLGAGAGHRLKTPAGIAIRDRSLRFMGFLVVIGLLIPNVDNMAHFAGFAIGAVLGWIFPLKDRASYRAGWFWGAGAALCGLLVVGSLAAQMIAVPKHLPNDLDFYPTGIFGNSLRDRDAEDPVVNDAEGACHRTLKQATAEGAAPDAGERAVANCDEILHYVPSVPDLWVLSGQAHLAAGDRSVGCRRVWIGRTLTYWHPAYRDGRYLAAVDAFLGEACR